MIPNGVMVIDIKSRKIEYANQEMRKIVDFTDSKPFLFEDVKAKICDFLIYERESSDDFEKTTEIKGVMRHSNTTTS